MKYLNKWFKVAFSKFNNNTPTGSHLEFLARNIRRVFRSFWLRKINIFDTDYSKEVLISYIIPKFNSRNSHHPKKQEISEIAKLFEEMGFNVDVSHYKYKPIGLDYSKYDIVFGFGEPFDRSFYADQCSAKRIHYATGAHVCFQNEAELERISNLKDRKGELLKPRRAVEKTWSASTYLSDAIISLGNEFTVKSYKEHFDGPIYNIPVTAYNYFPGNEINRNIEEARNHFLWFGSGGLVHKGLDLCLEAFKELPKKHLNICGPREEDFFELYKEELFHRDNIHYHGWVEVSSREFEKIVENTAFVIFPSCSEGGGSSVITAMKTGLIPLVTEEASVPLGNFGFLLKDTSVDYIINRVQEVSSLPVDELRNRSEESFEYSKTKHSLGNFRSELREALNRILNGEY